MKNTKFKPIAGTDEELIANARMLAQELFRHTKTLELRGIENQQWNYEDRTELQFERVTREKL